MSFNQQQKPGTFITKLKNISVEKKAFLYLFFMGVTGAIVGTIDSQIAIQKCVNSQNCTIENSAEKQITKISVGTCAGMIAATLISVPALLKEE